MADTHEQHKRFFRTVVGIVMALLFLLPPSVLILGTGPARTGIWHLKVSAAAVAVDTQTRPPTLEIIGVPDGTAGTEARPMTPSGLIYDARNGAPAREPTTWDRLEQLGGKANARGTPVDITAMLQEQLLILIAATLLWIALFGVPQMTTPNRT